MLKTLLILLTFITMTFSCMTTRKMADNQKSSGHFRLYSYPTKPAKEEYDEKRYIKFGISGSNNFNGNIQPHSYLIKNRFGENRIIKSGGISAVKFYNEILKSSYDGNFLYVDAGNFLNKTSDHFQTIFLFNYLGIDIASLGTNEFSLTSRLPFKQYAQKLTATGNLKLITSNIFDLKTTEKLNIAGIREDYIKEINGVRFGFVGIAFPESAKQMPITNINGLYFQNPAKNIILKSRDLRRKGAHIIVLLTNMGIDCTSKLAFTNNLSEYKVNFAPNSSQHCNTYKSPFYNTLQKLPKGTVDIIFTSGEKTKTANFILGYPVLQNFGEGEYLSLVEFYFDKKHQAIDRSKTVIKQPIQLCHHFLKDSQDCFVKENYDHQELIPAMFMGYKVRLRNVPKFYSK